jgi:5'-phosphate synthase pdxT subunit
MRIAILALQGAFIEHKHMLQQLGVETFEIRQLKDWQQPKDGLILPGGESTVQMRLLKELQLFDPIREAIQEGLPTFGTCAGMILLAQNTTNDDREHLATMGISVRRNAYGRQLGSFHTFGTMEGIGEDIPMTFIRAPYIEKVLSPECEVLAKIDGNIVAARQGKQLVTAFHPELDADFRVHEYFLKMCR